MVRVLNRLKEIRGVRDEPVADVNPRGKMLRRIRLHPRNTSPHPHSIKRWANRGVGPGDVRNSMAGTTSVIE